VRTFIGVLSTLIWDGVVLAYERIDHRLNRQFWADIEADRIRREWTDGTY
jgi:hypothetical protein